MEMEMYLQWLHSPCTVYVRMIMSPNSTFVGLTSTLTWSRTGLSDSMLNAAVQPRFVLSCIHVAVCQGCNPK